MLLKVKNIYKIHFSFFVSERVGISNAFYFISVVLDRRQSPDASTGTFELVYRQSIPKAPAYLGLSLCITGKKLFKKPKEKRHEPRCATPVAPRATSGDTIAMRDQPIPNEYSGPIITDFLSWLNPYDALPTNKDGILLGPKDSLTVRQAITVVKSGISLKSGSKKRKSSTISFRTTKGRRERNTECKRRIVPHSCCQPDEAQPPKLNNKYRTESAKSEKPKVDRSVGNKRCYIDPDEWERETASILRSTISVQNKMVNKPDTFLPIRQSKSGIVNAFGKPILESMSSRMCVDDGDPIKKLSAIGRSICKMRLQAKSHESSNVSTNISSKYAPYRVVISPINDNDKIKAFSTRKDTNY